MRRRTRAPGFVLCIAIAFVVVGVVAGVWFASNGGGASPLGESEDAHTFAASEKAFTASSIATPGVAADERRGAVVPLADVDERLAVLVVRVLDARGAPLAGRRLIVERTDRPREHAMVATDAARGDLELAPRSAADGRAEFVVPANVPLSLRTHGVAPEVVRDVPSLAPRERRELDIAITADDDVLTARLVARETGAPLSDAAVLDFPDGTTSLTLAREVARTDVDGRFRVARTAFTGRRAAFTAPDRAPRIESLANLAETVGLERGGELAVRVAVNRATGVRPIVTVMASVASLSSGPATEDDAPEVLAWTRTLAPDAALVLTELPVRAPLDVRVHLHGRRSPPRVESVELAPGERRELDVSFLDSSAVIGHVTSYETSRPQSGVEVWLAPGRIEPQGARGAAAWGDGSGAPPDTRVGFTDDNGEFRFDAVPPGAWRVGTPRRDRMREAATLTTSAITTVVQSVTVSGDGLDVLVGLRAHIGVLVAGRVVDPAGRPVAGAKLLDLFADGTLSMSFPLTAESDDVARESADDGSFVLGPFGPTDFQRVGDEGLFVIAKSPTKAFADSLPVRIEGPHAELELRLRTACRLEVRATDEGRPVAAALHAELLSPPVFAQAVELTKTAMAFGESCVFDGLAPGRYRALVTSSDGRAGSSDWIELDDAASTRTMSVELAPAASIEFVPPHSPETEGVVWRVKVDFEGQPLRTLHVSGPEPDRLAVPAGKIQLHIDALGFSDDDLPTQAARDAARKLREVVELEFALEPGAARVVRLAD